MEPIITLTTDFGLHDAYVGLMKGVILGISPRARLVDLCHEVPPQDVPHAAFLLLISYAYFPRGTIHLVVVDPDVGTERQALIVSTSRAHFVAPDNGVLSYVLAQEEDWQAVRITATDHFLRPVSNTFHGRDIFAPVAAHLSLGLPPRAFGEPVVDLATIPFPQPQLEPDGGIAGCILHLDRFGNLITNIPQGMLPPGQDLVVDIAGERLQGLSSTYAVVGEGEFVALIGSAGFLEVALRGGNAAARLGVRRGEPVLIRRL